MTRLTALSVALCVGAAGAFAQGATSRISGAVRDSSGAGIPKAAVVVLDSGRGVERLVRTGATGYYAVTQLQPGKYSVSAEAAGFRPVVRENVVVNVEQPVAIDFTLSIGPVNEAITVNDSAPLLNTESGALAVTVDSTLVNNLPLNGRTFQALLYLIPGVVPLGGLTSIGDFAVNGQRGTANATSLDGISANISGVNTLAVGSTGSAGITANGGMMATTTSGTTQAIATIDELQEFTVQTSGYDAEFGRQPGSQTSFTTRSGSNVLHGSLSDYFRNEVMDANDWFSNRAGTPRLKLRQNVFGGTVDGPIVKNITFFSVSIEHAPIHTPSFVTLVVPTAAYRAAAPALQPVLAAFPLPTANFTPDGLTGTDFFATGNQNTSQTESLRLDRKLGQNITLFGRYHLSSSSGRNANGTSISGTSTHTETATAGANGAFRRFVGDLRVNYSRNSFGIRYYPTTEAGATPVADSALFPAGFTSSEGMAAVRLLDAGSSNLQVGNALANVQHQVEIAGNVSYVKGAHTLKAGVDWRRLFPYYAGELYALSLTVQSAAKDQVLATGTAQDPVTLLFHSASLYAQDSWRVTRRLTVNGGLRWEFVPPPTTLQGPQPLAALNFNPNNLQTATVAPEDAPLWKTRYRNFAPRAGLAYLLTDRARYKTVLRAAFGLDYDLGAGDVLGFIGDAPFSRSSATFLGAYPGVLAQAIPGPVNLTPPFTGAVKLFDPNLRLPYTLNRNFTVEQILGDQTLRVSYVGAKGHRLIRTIQSQSITSTLGARQEYATVNQGDSSYNALQSLFQRRLSKGLQAVAAYTWSHSIDNNSNDGFYLYAGAAMNPDSIVPLRLDRASSDFDVRHAFTTGISWSVTAPAARGLLRKLTDGWSVSPLIRAYSAHPMQSATYNLTFSPYTFVLRPDLAPGVPVWLNDPGVGGGRKLNPAAYVIPRFTSPSQIRQGDLPRNAFRGFPVQQADLALRRTFHVREPLRIQFSAEFYNVLNHPTFGDPRPSLGSVVGAGTPTPPSPSGFQSVGMARTNQLSPLLAIYRFGGPRDVQLAVRVEF
jgi:hypothetical protein